MLDVADQDIACEVPCARGGGAARCHQRAPQPRPNCPCSRSRLQPRSRISCARRHHHPRWPETTLASIMQANICRPPHHPARPRPSPLPYPATLPSSPFLRSAGRPPRPRRPSVSGRPSPAARRCMAAGGRAGRAVWRLQAALSRGGERPREQQPAVLREHPLERRRHRRLEGEGVGARL